MNSCTRYTSISRFMCGLKLCLLMNLRSRSRVFIAEMPDNQKENGSRQNIFAKLLNIMVSSFSTEVQF